jgi:hypothetical protein
MGLSRTLYNLARIALSAAKWFRNIAQSLRQWSEDFNVLDHSVKVLQTSFVLILSRDHPSRRQ